MLVNDRTGHHIKVDFGNRNPVWSFTQCLIIWMLSFLQDDLVTFGDFAALTAHLRKDRQDRLEQHRRVMDAISNLGARRPSVGSLSVSSEKDRSISQAGKQSLPATTTQRSGWITNWLCW